MKLRNKHTGEVKEFNEIFLTKTVKETNTATSEYVERSYCSIAELIADFEDYKSKEPLIKDKRIRKAVRAWAEAIGISEVMVAHPSSSTTTLASISDPYKQISFSNERAFLPQGKDYTIAELCGEEEE